MLQRRFYTVLSLHEERRAHRCSPTTTDDTIMANLHCSAWTLCLAVVIVSQEDRSLLWLSFFLANFGDKIINVLSSGGVSDIPLFLYSDHWYSKVGLILIV